MRRTKKNIAVVDEAIEAVYAEPKNSLTFNELDYNNYGKFTPYVVDFGKALATKDESFDSYERTRSVAYSIIFDNNLPEVNSAYNRFLDFCLGSTFRPTFNGTNQTWAQQIKKNYFDKVTTNLTKQGVAVDWTTLWRLILRVVLVQGDCFVMPYKDRYGLPHVEVIEGKFIGSRSGETTVSGGRFDGYTIEDGTVKDENGKPVARKILGKTPEEDQIVPEGSGFMIYMALDTTKGRGRPIAYSANRAMRNQTDYQHYIPQNVKMESGVQYVVTNDTGTANPGRTSFNRASADGKTQVTTGTGSSQAANGVYGLLGNAYVAAGAAVTEYMQAGVRYVKTNGGKLEPFAAQRPAGSVQSYITNNQKEMLSPIFSQHLLLAAETIGGPGARGIKEVLVAQVAPWRKLIERYALLILQFILGAGMTNETIRTTFNVATNYSEDWTDWGFTKAPEPCFDLGAERAADLNDVKAGIKSRKEVIEKEGREEDDVIRETSESAQKLADAIAVFQSKNPALAQFAPQLFGLVTIPTIQPPNV